MQITRQEYFKRQKNLSKLTAEAELEAARKIKKKTREYILPLVKEYAETRNIIFPVEQLAHDITAIILEEAAKPVAAARKLHDDMEASLTEKLGISLRHRPEPQENARQRRLENAKYTDKDWKEWYEKYKAGAITEVQWRLFEMEYYDGRPEKTGRESFFTTIKTGRAWGYGTSGLASYYRDPQTGKIVWTDLPLEYQFRKRADLSEQVWKAVEEQEQMVFDVIRGGRAAGRNVKDICGDLEEYINKPNGGEIVVGRWGKMFPNTEEGRREAWKREYLTAHGGLQPGSDAAKALLRQPDAQEWVKQKMAETTKRGTPRLPDAVKQYASRLGKAGLDHRAIRIARTEMGNFLSDEQKEIARNSDISSGLVDWVMERGRDSWSCRCEELAKGGPYDVFNMVDKDGNPIDCPLHPNCCCELRPRLKTDEEILASLREEMKEDLETIQGTEEGREWQKDMLDRIDKMEAEGGGPPQPDYQPPTGDVDDEFEKRFGKEFTQLYNKSMDYIDHAEPMPDSVKKELEQYLGMNGKTVDGFINDVNDFIKTGEVVRHDPLGNFLDNIDDFEKDPRIKTQFETGTSQGAFSPEKRNHWERRLIGMADDYGEDPSASDIKNYGITNIHRPVYAEITKHHPLEGNASGYGPTAFILSDEAKNRASFTLDNSSCEGMGGFRNNAASIFSKQMVDARQNAQNFYQAQRHSNGYVEAQVWGGLDLSRGDVKAVVIDDAVFTGMENDTAFQRFIQVMKNNNVSVIKGSEWGKYTNSKNIDTHRFAVYNNIYKGKNMRLLAKNGREYEGYSDEAFIYDNSDEWYLHNKGNGVEQHIPKAEKPNFPLAACLKWGFQPVDVGYLNALSKGGLKAVEEYLKNNP